MGHPSRTTSRPAGPTANDSRVARRGVLRAGAGAATAVLGIAALGGRAAAHFPAELDVEIEPGSDDAPINPDGRGLIPVAVLATDEFDPTSEDVRYRFGAPDVVEGGGGARPAHGGHVEDANGGRRAELVLHFPVDETGFDGDESEGRLEWEETEAGEHGLSGTAAVTVVGRHST